MMEHLRGLIRTTITEMASKANMARFALVRAMKDPDIQRFVAALDAAQGPRDFWNSSLYPDKFIPNLYDRKEMVNDESLRHVLFSMSNEREAELRRKQKVRERAAIDAKKAASAEKKAAVSAKAKSGLSNPILKSALDKIGADFHQQIKSRIMEDDVAMVERHFINGKCTLLRPTERGWAGEMALMSYNSIHSKLMPFIKPHEGYRSYMPNEVIDEFLREDWERVSTARADMNASTIVEKWKYKMALKLGEVIDRKGGANIDVKGLPGNEHMEFLFSDGSNFNMKTQQVFVKNKQGTEFWRFPTTFHNVKFADGTAMATPSSEKMQAEFGISDATASKD